MKSLITIRSQAVRSWMITGVMAGVLAGSLGLSYAFTTWQPSRPLSSQPRTVRIQRLTIDGLALTLPISWRQAAFQPRFQGLQSSVVMDDTISTNRTLMVGSFQVASGTSPASILTPITRLIVGKDAFESGQRVSGVTGFRNDRLIGARYAGASRSQTGLTLHLLAVLSDPEGRSWVVYLSHSFDDGSLNPQSLTHNEAILNNILISATLQDAKTQEDRTRGDG